MGNSERTSTEHSVVSEAARERAARPSIFKEIDLEIDWTVNFDGKIISTCIKETQVLEAGKYFIKFPDDVLIYLRSEMPGNPYHRQELPVVHVEKCPCEHPGCSKYGLDYGSFEQGTGWSEADAIEIAKRINMFPFLVYVLKSVWRDNPPMGLSQKVMSQLVDTLHQCGYTPELEDEINDSKD